jgi:hypothetical protein
MGIKEVMRSLKIIILSLVVVGLVFVLTSCEVTRQTVIVDEETGRRTIITDGEEPVTDPIAYWRDYYLASGELEYFDTIEEAIANNLHWQGALPREINEKIRLFEYENTILLFFTSRSTELGGGMTFNSAFASIKEINGERRYSNFFWGFARTQNTAASVSDFMWLSAIGEIRYDISIENAFRYHSISSSERFIWGLSGASDAKYLKVMESQQMV